MKKFELNDIKARGLRAAAEKAISEMTGEAWEPDWIVEPKGAYEGVCWVDGKQCTAYISRTENKRYQVTLYWEVAEETSEDVAEETSFADTAYFVALAADYEAGKGAQYSEGTARALGMWRRSVGLGESEMDISDIIFDRLLPDFVASLRSAGLNTLVITCDSTGLLKQLQVLTELGCTVDGPVMVDHVSKWSEETVPGLRVRIA